MAFSFVQTRVPLALPPLQFCQTLRSQVTIMLFTLTLLYPPGGVGKLHQATFSPVPLQSRKMELCAFVTFPEYGWATKRRIYWKYTYNQKSTMAARKLEMSCRLTLFYGRNFNIMSRVLHHQNVISKSLRIFSRSWRSVA